MFIVSILIIFTLLTAAISTLAHAVFLTVKSVRDPNTSISDALDRVGWAMAFSGSAWVLSTFLKFAL